MKAVLFVALLSLVFANAETMQTKSVEMISSPTGTFKDENLVSTQVSVIFYRLGNDKNLVATVKAGENVVGSLLPNHYAITKACKKRLLVGVAERGDIINITHYDLSNLNNISNTIYIKVIEPTSNNRFTLSVIDSKVAQKEISSLNLKSNIINRHVPSCEKLDNVSNLLKSITIETYSLFDVDDSRLNKQAIMELSRLTKDIKAYEHRTNSINISGYTDRLGSEKYNLALSQKRANRVSEYIRSNGVIKDIESVGLGESNPISSGCDKLKASSLKECLKTDRRVVVKLMIKRINPTNTKIPKELLWKI